MTTDNNIQAMIDRIDPADWMPEDAVMVVRAEQGADLVVYHVRNLRKPYRVEMGTVQHKEREERTMDAYEIMRSWDEEAGLSPRSNEDLDLDVPGGLTAGDYEDWKERLENDDVDAIIDGRRTWGLSIFV